MSIFAFRLSVCLFIQLILIAFSSEFFAIRIRILCSVPLLEHLLLDALPCSNGQFLLQLWQALPSLELPSLGDVLSLETAEVREARHGVVFPVLPVRGRVADEVELSEVGQFRQVVHAFLKIFDVDEVERQINFLQALAASNALD